MRCVLIPEISAAVLIGVLVANRAACGVEVSAITVRVEQFAKGDHDKFAHTQEKSLKVFLTNGSDRDFEGLRVKYFFFARDLKGGDLTLYERGERSANVAAHATMMIETPAATTRYTEEHAQGNPFGGKGKRSGGGGKAQKTKVIEASGQRIVGHAVQVFTGGKLVGEVYSEPSLKAKIGG